MAEVIRTIPESAWSKYSIPIDISINSDDKLYPSWTLVKDSYYHYTGTEISAMKMSTDEIVYVKIGNVYKKRNLFITISPTGIGAATTGWTTDNKRYYMAPLPSNNGWHWIQWDSSAPQGTYSGTLKTVTFSLDGSIAQIKARQKEIASIDYTNLAAFYKKFPVAAGRSGGVTVPAATMPGTDSPSPQAGAAGSESDKSGGRSNSPSRPNNTTAVSPIQPGTFQKITRVETTNNISVAAKDFAVTPDTPYILQTYTLADQVNPNNYSNIRKIFTIDIVPNSFEFSQLSSTWNEIDRPGNFALTDWGKYNLLKVTFKFVISSKIKEGPLDGMKNSIETQLDLIRKIAQTPYPIRLVNCTPYLSKSWKFPFTKTGEEIQFVISDLSVNTTRFTPGGIHEASVAEVTLNLTEYSDPNMGTLAVLPPLKKASTAPRKPPGTQATNQYTKTTDFLTGALLPTVGTDSTTQP
jgi:hypothetical protein